MFWYMDFIYVFGGIVLIDEWLKVYFCNVVGEFDFDILVMWVYDWVLLLCIVFVEVFMFLWDVVVAVGIGVILKLMILLPSMVHYCGGWVVIDEGVYFDFEVFWVDLVGVYWV